jgi:hypothetical protein
VHVRLAGGAVPEGFEQHELIGTVDASRPLKEDVTRLGACGSREGGDTRQPLVRDFWTNSKLDGYEDHRCSLHITCCFFWGAPYATQLVPGWRARHVIQTARIEGDGLWHIVRA